MKPDAYVLGFDTSAAHCAAAVVLDDRILACRIEPMEKGQAERLMILLAEVLAEAGITYSELAAIGVGTGPGNFTGVRISVAAARGLALALAVPAIGVTGFEALALGLPPGAITTIDARRGALWLAADGISPGSVTLDALPDGLAGRDAVGERAAEIAAITGGRLLMPTLPLPVAIARIADQRRTTPQPRPAPLYLRGADAAPPRDPPPVILP